MSQRERWVVYPLLLMALINTFKNTTSMIGSEITFKDVKARRLEIVGSEGKPVILMGPTRTGGQVVVKDRDVNLAYPPTGVRFHVKPKTEPNGNPKDRVPPDPPNEGGD